MSNRLQRLNDAGQSVWLDFIDRRMLLDGEHVQRIRDDALMAMTSNPTTFEQALAEGTAYDEQLTQLGGARSARALFEEVATHDVRRACDLFRPVYDATKGVDGYVSLEVSPNVATDTEGTITEARRLWAQVDRPNVMIKVPGTPEGTAAVRQLIEDGININVTLLFAVDAHRRVIEAYIEGLEARARRDEPVDQIASVASFFVSRVDSEIDRQLDAQIAASTSDDERARLTALRGRAAIANAKLAYRLFAAMFHGARWEGLLARGARVQRPLWASTSTKDPAYRDVLYVEELVGPHTVNTMPPATLEAFRDHGEVRRSVDVGVDDAVRTLRALEDVGISMEAVTGLLLTQGLASFQKSFDSLLAGLETKRRELAIA